MLRTLLQAVVCFLFPCLVLDGKVLYHDKGTRSYLRPNSALSLNVAFVALCGFLVLGRGKRGRSARLQILSDYLRFSPIFSPILPDYL